MAAASGSNTLLVASSQNLYLLNLANGTEIWHGKVAGVVGGIENPVIVNDPARGVDKLLKAEAQRQSKTVSGFETAAKQVHFFADLPNPEQVAYLRNVLDGSAAGPPLVNALVAAWLAGDLDALAKIENEQFRDRDGALYRELVVKRNAALNGFNQWTINGGRVVNTTTSNETSTQDATGYLLSYTSTITDQADDMTTTITGNAGGSQYTGVIPIVWTGEGGGGRGGGLAGGAVERAGEFDELIGRHARGWTVTRIAPLERSILRVALVEMLHPDAVPAEEPISPEGAIDELNVLTGQPLVFELGPRF